MPTAPHAHADHRDEPRDEPPETDPSDRLASSITRWVCLLSGVALLASAMILPAHEELARVEHQRDTALAIRAHHEARNARYQQALGSIDRGDPGTIARLTHASLGLIPASTRALVPEGGPLRDPMLFELLEPEPPATPRRDPSRSRLERLVLDPATRLWVIAGAALLTLIGLLPRAQG